MRATNSLRASVRGAVAGAIGTVAMDTFWYKRYRARGGADDPVTWEFGGPSRWDSVSAPAQMGRRLYEALLGRPLPERQARLTNNVMHWGYGMACAAGFGLVAGSLPRSAARGPLFGTAVWLSGYVTLPLAGLSKPIWQYGIGELGPELAAHLCYGTATDCAFRLLSAAVSH